MKVKWKLILRSRRTPRVRKIDLPAAPEPFGQLFERKFRQHPGTIAVSLLLTGFAAGFSARSALHDSGAAVAVLCLLAGV